ncbi:MAG TPA: type II toxin-antitoxin system RelE/ParE family toxin [Candidatus Binatia bacterium]|nr:type II toxin-antitoxin system RelE/ParE family toxin [Candidatus Binatia bacterium]
MKLYGFLEPAQIEFDEAVSFYNHQREYLGDEFAAEVLNTINRILSHPEAWTKLSKRTRRCRTNRFPYSVIYQIRGGGILIVAVAHSRRNPKYWRERLRPN